MRKRGNWCSAKVWDPPTSQGGSWGNQLSSSQTHNRQGSTFPFTGGLLEDFITGSLLCDLELPHIVCSHSHSSLLSLHI